METEDETVRYLTHLNEVHQCGYGHRRAMILLEPTQTEFK